MKTFIVALSLLFIVACTQKKDQLSTEEHRADSLQLTVYYKNSVISRYRSILEEIKAALDSINIKERNIFFRIKNSSDLGPSVVEEINTNIAAINWIITKNNQRIADLNSALKKAEQTNEESSKIIEALNSQVAKRDSSLHALNLQLKKSNRQDIEQIHEILTYLIAENYIQDELLMSQQDELETAYFTVGSLKDLQAKKIVDSQRRLFGMIKTNAINQNFNSDWFTRINYHEVTVIFIDNNKPEILTTHPEDTYILLKLNNKKTELHIIDPEKFWSISKYLVIIKN